MAMNEKIRILAVVGPTASGKSALAVALARRLGGEIVSCDSMQIYRGMDIGTAKPTKEEMEGIPHHLLDVAECDKPFSSADYVRLASDCIKEISSRGVLPILCGGTGLYLDALLRGGFEEGESNPARRQELMEFASLHGNRALHDRLAEIDPESAASIHENNVKRVIRAIEIYETTGLTKTESDLRSRTSDSPYDATVIGLRYSDREHLYERIDRRVDGMLSHGLAQEAKRLLDGGVFEKNRTAAQAIGYKELLPFLCGEESEEAAAERLKLATRHYAKRQLTWFGKKEYVRWIDATKNGQMRPFDAILADALALATASDPD